MNVRNLLADAFDSAASRIRNNSCGMTDQEMEAALHKMLYLLDSDHHFNEDNARAAIAQMYYFYDDTHKRYAPFFPYLRQDVSFLARRLQFLGFLRHRQPHVLQSY